MAAKDINLAQILEQQESKLLDQWVQEQRNLSKHLGLKEADLQNECKTFLSLLKKSVRDGDVEMRDAAWEPVRKFLTDLSRNWVMKGANPAETATFIFSLKKPLFEILNTQAGDDSKVLSDAIWKATILLDRMGLFTVEAFQKSREDIIRRQQQDMLELSTPVVSLADGILALPLIGTLDSERTQVVMESLLQRIVETGSTVAIIDITGVPTVDTLVAQHLLKTVTAARLMGAECIISGIRPQIAQTIVHLGVELGDVSTKANLADAFKLALSQRGMAIVRRAALGRQAPG